MSVCFKSESYELLKDCLNEFKVSQSCHVFELDLSRDRKTVLLNILTVDLSTICVATVGEAEEESSHDASCCPHPSQSEWRARPLG